jgi:hypothetical protein
MNTPGYLVSGDIVYCGQCGSERDGEVLTSCGAPAHEPRACEHRAAVLPAHEVPCVRHDNLRCAVCGVRIQEAA